jgi:hypothetical protein
LASAVVAAVIAGIVSLVVGRWTSRATAAAARVAAREGRAKAADEERRQCRAALVRATEGWHIAALEDADWRVRQENAGKARGGLIEVASILGERVRTSQFEQFLSFLAAREETDLERAAELWPRVQETIIGALEQIDDGR